jgi:FkbM family methyltransferase
MLLEKIKKIKRILTGNDFFYKTTLSLKDKKIGSDYGGWWIAIDDLQKKELVIFSFGLGEDVSFDIEIIKEYECNIFGFDPTPKSIKYVESLKLPKNFKLYKYALSDKAGTLKFNLPKNEEHVSGSLENIASGNTVEVICKDLKSICEELSITNIDILKMDIEGSEYRVIENMILNNIKPKQILVEYHHFFTSFKNIDTKNSIELLLKNGYELFHIDGYNYSFIRV